MKIFNNTSNLQEASEVEKAYLRIKDYLIETPIITCDLLNERYGHEIYFKVESLQKSGAFKVRGVLNHLLALKERGELPERIVAYSTGNHGLGLAWVANLLKVKARIYLPKYTSVLKQKFATIYGAEVIYTDTRQQAEDNTYEDKSKGYYYLHPSDSDLTIAGAGTMCYEALKQLKFPPDAIFASCGGGGLLSGSYLAKELLSPSSLIFGTEPAQAKDAYDSVKEGKICRFSKSPETFADGLKTLGVSNRTFEYLKKLDGIYLVEEDKIAYWTFWLAHLLKVYIEPSAAINMDPAINWCSGKVRQKILILLSGGNIDPSIFKTFTSKIIDNSPLEKNE